MSAICCAWRGSRAAMGRPGISDRRRATSPASPSPMRTGGRAPSRDMLVATNTDGFLVAQDGKIVAEIYMNGMERSTLHLSQSVVKSFTSTLVGILVGGGRDRYRPSGFRLHSGAGELRLSRRDRVAGAGHALRRQVRRGLPGARQRGGRARPRQRLEAAPRRFRYAVDQGPDPQPAAGAAAWRVVPLSLDRDRGAGLDRLQGDRAGSRHLHVQRAVAADGRRGRRQHHHRP